MITPSKVTPKKISRCTWYFHNGEKLLDWSSCLVASFLGINHPFTRSTIKKHLSYFLPHTEPAVVHSEIRATNSESTNSILLRNFSKFIPAFQAFSLQFVDDLRLFAHFFRLQKEKKVLFTGVESPCRPASIGSTFPMQILTPQSQNSSLVSDLHILWKSQSVPTSVLTKTLWTDSLWFLCNSPISLDSFDNIILSQLRTSACIVPSLLFSKQGLMEFPFVDMQDRFCHLFYRDHLRFCSRPSVMANAERLRFVINKQLDKLLKQGIISKYRECVLRWQITLDTEKDIFSPCQPHVRRVFWGANTFLFSNFSEKNIFIGLAPDTLVNMVEKKLFTMISEIVSSATTWS